jgi:hypothetical protein
MYSVTNGKKTRINICCSVSSLSLSDFVDIHTTTTYVRQSVKTKSVKLGNYFHDIIVLGYL